MQESKTFSNWDILGSDLTENILSRLLIPSILRATYVSKEWHSIVHSHSFITSASHYSTNHPWLFLPISTNRAFAYDPLSNRWLGPLTLPRSIPVDKTWPIQTLPDIFFPGTPFQMVSLISCQDRLVLARLCWFSGAAEFVLWRVDEDRLELEEIGIMPPELFSSFICCNGSCPLKCNGSGNLVYVWNGGNGKVCVCEIDRNGKCSWKMIPELAGFQEDWDSCFCRNVCLGDYLK